MHWGCCLLGCCLGGLALGLLPWGLCPGAVPLGLSVPWGCDIRAVAVQLYTRTNATSQYLTLRRSLTILTTGLPASRLSTCPSSHSNGDLAPICPRPLCLSEHTRIRDELPFEMQVPNHSICSYCLSSCSKQAGWTETGTASCTQQLANRPGETALGTRL